MRRLAPGLLTLLLGTTVLAVLPAAPAGAVATVTVTSTADLTFLARGTTLREAIDLAEQGSDPTTIVLAAGATYRLTLCGATEDANANGDLDVNGTAGTVLIEGNGAVIEQTCPGERVIDHAGPRLTLRRVTVRGGDVTGDGGGIRSTSGLTLDRATVTRNVATGDGGGIRSANLIVEASTVLANQAGGDGGGIHSSLPVASPSGVNLIRSEVRANAAAGTGGGVRVAGSLAMDRSSIVRNRAGATGGAAALIADLENATIADNTETGGASPLAAVELDVASAGINARFTTIRGGTGDGGALGVVGPLTATGLAIRSGGAGSACEPGTDDFDALGGSLDDDDTCGFDHPDDRPGDLVGLNAPLALNGGTTRSIKPESFSNVTHRAACGAVALDQRGVARPQGPACDAGAVELRYRVDALVRAANVATFSGDGIVNTTGAGQSVVSTGSAPTFTFVWRVQNDGEAAETYRLRGPASDNRFTVRYELVANGSNITTAVTGPGHFRTVQPGLQFDIRVVMTRRPAGISRTLDLRVGFGNVTVDLVRVTAVRT